MTKQSLKYTLVFFLLLSTALAGSSQKRLIQNAHVGVIYPVSTNGTLAGEYTNHFSFHIFSGLSRNERGFVLSGLSTIVKDSVTGLQVSGIYNHAGKQVTGAQIAGIANTSGGNAGLQVAGTVNVVKGNSAGLQVGGLVNLVKDTSNGLQVAGLVNKNAVGRVQVGGLVNVSTDAITQIGGLACVSSKATFQVSGLINTASDVNTQIGGLVNVARKVKGVQIGGLLNIADSSDYSIGIINIIRNGERSAGVTTDENLTTMLAFRSGGRIMYGIIGVGYNLKSRNDLYALELGLGAHLRISDKFRVNPEAAVSTLADFHRGEYFKTSYRILAAWKPVKGIELFAGPAFNFIEYTNEKGSDLDDHYLWSRTRNNRFKGFTIGAMGGMQVNL